MHTINDNFQTHVVSTRMQDRRDVMCHDVTSTSINNMLCYNVDPVESICWPSPVILIQSVKENQLHFVATGPVLGAQIISILGFLRMGAYNAIVLSTSR